MVHKEKDKKVAESSLQEWFIILGEQQLGPYSLKDLKNNPNFNPDTFVWRQGLPKWVQARFILELQTIFKDASANMQTPAELEEQKSGDRDLAHSNQETLTLQQDPYQFLLWILLLLLIFCAFYQFYNHF